MCSDREDSLWDVAVIGAGAAGLIAAWRAACRGQRTLLLEKNSKLGVKILMSGGTRCNITHDTNVQGIARAFGRQGKFLLSALTRFGPQDLVATFEEHGVPTKIESTGKIFPQSDRALDVRDALVALASEAGAVIKTRHPVVDVDWDSPTHSFAIACEESRYSARSIIVTTGGKSYPGCGTTGDGYAWVSRFGHTIVPTVPALAPIVSGDQWLADLKGVSLIDVEIKVNDHTGGKLGQARGPLLFTHFGLSGPAPMNVSRAIELNEGAGKKMVLDFFPDLNPEQLRDYWNGLFTQHAGLTLTTGSKYIELPRRLLLALGRLAGIDADKKFSEYSRQEHRQWLAQLKSTEVSVSGTRGYAKAEVTAGGVSLKEVDGATMQSKIQIGLFLAGEILDLDGPIGGFNFQAAFSTGYVAGENA